MAINLHFTDNEYVNFTLETIFEAFGEAFITPYASEFQPMSINSINTQELLQFDLPAGGMIKPLVDSSAASIEKGINNLMIALAPYMSAFGMISTILEVIKGIIEVICSLLNPFAVKRAIRKFIRKYVPKLIALFPPLAGVIIVLSMIKMILSMVVFFLTVVVSTVELIVQNAKTINSVIKNRGSQDQIKAGKEKIINLIGEITNKLGLLESFMPLLDMILLLLGISISFPCKDECCESDVCPDVIKNPPNALASVVPIDLEGYDPYFAFEVTLSDNRVSQLRQYNQNSPTIINCCPAGGSEDCPNFTVKVSSRRGGSNFVISPIVDINNNTITVVDPQLKNFIGVARAEIIPNYDALIIRNIIGIGCHPEIVQARLDAADKFPNIENPVTGFEEVGGSTGAFGVGGVPGLNSIPGVPTISDIILREGGGAAGDGTRGPTFNNLSVKYGSVVGGLNGYVNQLNSLTSDPIGVSVPYDTDAINNVGNGMVALLNDFSDDLNRRLIGIIDKSTNINNSSIDVDKNLVRANYKDIATISVIIRDDSGAPILKNMPQNAIPKIEIYSTIGELFNKKFNRSDGSITMNIKSPISGTAEISAKVNSKFISDKISGVNVIRKVKVKFVADSVLSPRRRNVDIVDKEPKKN